MKNHLSLFLLVSLLISLPSSLFAGQNNVSEARNVVEMLNKGQFDRITTMFDSTMKKAAPVSRLAAIWNSLLGQTGEFEKQLGAVETHAKGYAVVVVTCKFQKSVIDVKVVLDNEGKIAGLFFAPNRAGDTQSSENGGSAQGKEPYVSRDVTFRNAQAGVTLAGTLTLPDSKGKCPAVLLIAGSGPNNRNEVVAGHEIFRTLADYLTRHGIAVLRYDKRGVGQSTGDYSAATTMSFASDALAGVDYLKTVSQIKTDEIGVIGHSEGGEIAPIVADHSPAVSYMVLLGAPGVPGYRIILSQIALIDKASGQSRGAIDSALALEKKLLRIARTEKDSAKAASKLKSVLEKTEHEPSEAASVAVSELLSPWTREFISYDPAPALAKVKCPVLALWGSKDLQVPPSENMPAVRRALKRGGNKNYKVMELKGLNHLFQTAKTGSPLEYGTIKESISPKVLSIITNWILRQARNRR